MSEWRGGPAFPTNSTEWTCERTGDCGGEPAHSGMFLRDYFAAKALIGLVTTPRGGNDYVNASTAYDLADAMLRARSVVRA